jgi:tripartite-type tricarboxylate transporter receptor subunit TctC
MTTYSRRTMLAAPALLAAPAVAYAQAAWPNRTVRIVSPFAPGGPQDVPGRFMVDWLQPRLGQPVIYESRAGAGGAVGMQHVVQANDGHTFLLTSSAVATLPGMRRELGFDPQTDLQPVSIVAESALLITARPNGPAGLADFLARAKANPGRVSYGSSGTGSTTHLAGALLGQMAGVDLLHVPYRGATPALNALLAGDVDTILGDPAIPLEHIRAGTLRGIAVTTAERNPVLPEVPALAEAVPGFAVPLWFGLLTGKATPAEGIRRMLAELAPLRSPESELSKRLAATGGKLLFSDAAALGERLRKEIPQWRQVIQRAGITPE